MMMIPKKGHHGFTLIELMIVVAIAAILASVAYPAFTNSVKRGNRAEARSALLDLAARQERHYSDNRNQYTGTITDLIADPANCTATGVQSETCLYTLTAASPDANNQTFTITATPTFSDTECGAFTITQTGQKGSGGSLEACWGK
jgi:type IV pilus assembly protein PilE